jgi:cytochrome c
MNDSYISRRQWWAVILLMITFLWGCTEDADQQRMTSPANPGATANPGVATTNPLNPCAAASAQVDPSKVTRPEGTELFRAARSELVTLGSALWKDATLSSNGLSCSTCHMDNQAFLATFAKPYPHKVEMATSQAHLGEIQVDEMVQLCMVVPMQAEPLPWDSKELAALAAYSTDVAQKEYVTAIAANPCMVRTSTNPCNPCAAKGNPHAANPCMGKRNPCNPCSP